MLTQAQKHKISLLAVFSMVLALIAGVPHYDHADTNHTTPQEQQAHLALDSGTGDIDSSVDCDHGCHLSHHFSGILADTLKSYALLSPSNANPTDKHLLGLITIPEIRPPIV